MRLREIFERDDLLNLLPLTVNDIGHESYSSMFVWLMKHFLCKIVRLSITFCFAYFVVLALETCFHTVIILNELAVV